MRKRGAGDWKSNATSSSQREGRRVWRKREEKAGGARVRLSASPRAENKRAHHQQRKGHRRWERCPPLGCSYSHRASKCQTGRRAHCLARVLRVSAWNRKKQRPAGARAPHTLQANLRQVCALPVSSDAWLTSTWPMLSSTGGNALQGTKGCSSPSPGCGSCVSSSARPRVCTPADIARRP